MSDGPTPREEPSALDETPIEPRDVASAARSCSVLLLILAALVLIACVFAAIAVVK